MRYIISASLLLFLNIAGFTQVDLSRLSPKERMEIAEKEEREAATDPEFVDLMEIGHSLFEEQHYLKAIHKYEEAQKVRPYNVYPSVIITDIELSMKDTLKVLRKAEEQEKRKAKRTPAIQPEKPVEEKQASPPPVSETKEERIEKINEWERNEREKLSRQRELEKEKKEEKLDAPVTSDVEIMSLEDYKLELGREFPEGITEQVFKEGNKTITRRVVVRKGKGNEYKKVMHDWGGVFYFKNGDPVTERVWLHEASYVKE